MSIPSFNLRANSFFFCTAQFIESVHLGGLVHTGMAVATTGYSSPGNSLTVRVQFQSESSLRNINPDVQAGHTLPCAAQIISLGIKHCCALCKTRV